VKPDSSTAALPPSLEMIYVEFFTDFATKDEIGISRFDSFGIIHLTSQLTTPWSIVPLGKRIVSQIFKKLPDMYGTPRFITLSTRARH
jgi:hypothetical protein